MRNGSIAAYPETGHVEELESHFGSSTDPANLNAGICLNIWTSVGVVQPCQTAPWGNSTSLPYADRQENLWLSG